MILKYPEDAFRYLNTSIKEDLDRLAIDKDLTFNGICSAFSLLGSTFLRYSRNDYLLVQNSDEPTPFFFKIRTVF